MGVSPQHLADPQGESAPAVARALARDALEESGWLGRQTLHGVARCSARSFLVSLVATFLLCVCAMLAFSWYVNPWGDFGPVGYHQTYNVRLTKTDYLDGLAPEALPEVVVLGSSTSMQYHPESIEQRLGLRAFNYAVAWGRTEDFFCILQHLVVDLDHRPKLVMIGLNTWSFGPTAGEHPVFPTVRRRLLNTQQLVRHHPDVGTIKLHWSKFVDALSWQQLRLSWKLIHDHRATRGPYSGLDASDWFAIDGSLRHYIDPFGSAKNVYDEVEAGRFPITARLNELVAAKRFDDQVLAFPQRLFGFDAFDAQRVELMERTLELCDREGVEVVLVINPIHPVLLDVLCERTSHPANLARLGQLLTRLERDHSSVKAVVDASDISSFGGDADGFSDPYHASAHNCDLILDRVAEQVRER